MSLANDLGLTKIQSFSLTVLVKVEYSEYMNPDEIHDRVMQECDYSVDYEDSECKIINTQLLDGEAV